MTKMLMTYALGRGTDYYDMPVVRGIVRDAAKQNYRFSALVMGIVNSPAVPDEDDPSVGVPKTAASSGYHRGAAPCARQYTVV